MLFKHFTILGKKVSWLYLIPTFIVGGIFVQWVLQGKIQWLVPASLAGKHEINRTPDYTIKRVQGFENIRPLLTVETAAESPIFDPLKQDLTSTIDTLTKAGTVSEVSIFFKEFEHGNWMAINPDKKYHPASLMKVPLLLAMLRSLEADPSQLKKEVTFEKPVGMEERAQFYKYPTIEVGKKYTVHELLFYMIAYSDNNATWVVSRFVSQDQIAKLFAEMGLPTPRTDDPNFTLTPRDYSLFFNAIFNSSYLSSEFSEYSADLLSNCSFKEGFGKGFPTDTKMWHKFGEWQAENQPHELHEVGIVFVKEKPFLLMVMTKGNDTERQAEAIQTISKEIYKHIEAP
ncbi:MAG: serine hydrolase [Bacteroidetes bacterium]|nr:serine hydrolase [Bacteroidota bacterium]